MTTPISFVPAATNTYNPDAAKASLAGNYDTFLKILTAQIQNQDPLEPMDSSKFTDQLVQFSGVEQQIRSNDSLKQLISASQASTGASLAGYLGQDVELDSAGAQYAGTDIKWRYALPDAAVDSIITVTNRSGKVVYSTAGEKTAGAHDFTWDGSVFGGGKAADDAYYINVVAKNANDQALTPAYSLVTRVTGVDLSYGEPALTTAQGVFAYSDVLRLMRAS